MLILVRYDSLAGPPRAGAAPPRTTAKPRAVASRRSDPRTAVADAVAQTPRETAAARAPPVASSGKAVHAVSSAGRKGPFGSAAVFVIITGSRLEAVPFLGKNIELIAPLFTRLSVTFIHDSRFNVTVLRQMWSPPSFIEYSVIQENNQCLGADGKALPTMAPGKQFDYMNRLGKARQTYIDLLNDPDRSFGDCNWTIVVDSDMCLRWNPAGFESALSQFGDNGVAAVYANSIGGPGSCVEGRYEDRLAFDPRLPPEHRNADAEEAVRAAYFETHRLIRNNTYLRPDQRAFKAARGFGGVGIYRTRFFRQCRYSCNTKQRCEHYAMDDCLRSKGWSLVVDPALVIPWKSVMECMWRKIKDGRALEGERIPPLHDVCAATWVIGHRYVYTNISQHDYMDLPHLPDITVGLQKFGIATASGDSHAGQGENEVHGDDDMPYSGRLLWEDDGCTDGTLPVINHHLLGSCDVRPIRIVRTRSEALGVSDRLIAACPALSAYRVESIPSPSSTSPNQACDVGLNDDGKCKPPAMTVVSYSQILSECQQLPPTVSM